jgi:UDP-glucose 4-epimerase
MGERRVLITGGSGFIGSHLVRKFSEHGDRVTVMDIRRPDYELDDMGTFVQRDIFDPKDLKSLVEDADDIIHLVGLADSRLVQNDPMKSFRLNIVSLQNVLEVCREAGQKKIIFPSSAAVYGTTDDLPIKENSPPNLTNTYSWHKFICERMIQAYQKNYDLRYVILRLFNVYGKGNEGVIGLFIDRAKKGETIESFGPFQYRDFVYAGDVAEAIYHAVVYDKAVNRTINIGTGKGTQIREILDMICGIYPGAKWKELRTNFIMYDSIADITLARILLDFNPRSSPEFLKRIITEEMI